MLDKILPVEEKKFKNLFNNNIESHRENLKKAQDEDSKRVDERIKALKWNELRKMEKEKNM